MSHDIEITLVSAHAETLSPRCRDAYRFLAHRFLAVMDGELAEAIDRVLSLSGGNPTKGKLIVSRCPHRVEISSATAPLNKR